MKNNKAFTLVELIVVITILAILGTIAFISLQWQQKAREWYKKEEIKQEYICEDVSEIITNTNVLWKSWSNESQAIWAIWWAEIWAMVWMFWGPIWSAIWWGVWLVVWWVAWTFDRAIDYEVYTKNWTYVCQEKKCENILWESFRTDWEKIIKEECEWKNIIN